MILMSGCLSNRPDITMRPMATLVSYGQPNAHHMSYQERSSVT